MATNVAAVTPAARKMPRQVVNTLKKTVNYNDAGIADGLAFGNSLPDDGFILDVLVEIVIAFNGGTTNVLTVGTVSTAYNNIVAAGDVDETALAVTRVTRALGRGLTAAGDVTPYVKFTESGTAATTGQAIVTIIFEGGWPT